MKALVLSGGKGTRLRPLTYTIAKQLIPVANKPILHFCLENIIEAGIDDIYIVISPETGGLIQESLSSSTLQKKANLTYIVQDKPLGLAHAVKVAKSYLGDDDFIMYLGDNLIKYNLSDMINDFKKHNAHANILLKEVENPALFGVAIVDSSKNIIVELEEKPKNPKSNLALVGVYLFSPIIHDAIANIAPSKRGELEITDAIYYLVKKELNVRYKILTDWWLDTGKKDDLLEANRIVLDDYISLDINGNVDSNSKIVGRVEIGKGTVIENSTIRGPSAIGKNCSIKNSFIGSFTSIDDNVIIENSEITHSVILQNTQIKNVSGTIDESLIGSNVVLMQNDCLPKSHKLLVGDDSILKIM